MKLFVDMISHETKLFVFFIDIRDVYHFFIGKQSLPHSV